MDITALLKLISVLYALSSEQALNGFEGDDCRDNPFWSFFQYNFILPTIVQLGKLPAPLIRRRFNSALNKRLFRAKYG